MIYSDTPKKKEWAPNVDKQVANVEEEENDENSCYYECNTSRNFQTNSSMHHNTNVLI